MSRNIRSEDHRENCSRSINDKYAQNVVEIVLENSKLSRSKTILLSLWGILTEINVAINNYQKAFDYQSEAIVLKDGLDSQKIKNEFICTDFKRMRNEKSKLELHNQVIATRFLTYNSALYNM